MRCSRSDLLLKLGDPLLALGQRTRLFATVVPFKAGTHAAKFVAGILECRQAQLSRDPRDGRAWSLYRTCRSFASMRGSSSAICPLQELQGGRGGIWIDTCQVSVGRDRPPWLFEGVSRRTWERNGQTVNGLALALLLWASRCLATFIAQHQHALGCCGRC
jgi:hypothetical protein